MKKLLIILIVLNIAMPTAFARQQGSSIPPRTVLSKDTINPGFDATQQIFQKRYQHPDAVPFDTLWKNNVYISLFGGMDKMIPRGNADFNTGPVGGIAANWQFAPAHILRASLSAGNFSRKIDNETLVRFGLQADYLLNVSSYVNGYNPGRIFEFLTVAGIGYQLSSLAGRMEHVADLHLGFQLKLHPTAHVDFYLEPRFTIMSDGIDHSFQKNWHKYDKTYFVIWTTTTWTLPANEAICLNGQFEYSFVKIGEEYHIMATELVKSVMDACHITDYEVVGEPVSGAEFELMRYQHVYLPKEGWVILGDHVTLESGSGCVHTAGGHGVDDFNVCQKYPQVPITVPVDDGGYLTDLAGKYAGQRVWAANKTILADLTASGAVMGQVHIKHQYPHCWRCHHPIIFRATEQWFCSVAKFREDVYKAIDTVQWMPDWGHDRMKGMVRDRNDWCISRQRTWGVPIPAFYCKKCGAYHITDATIKAVSELFRKEGSDAWYKYEAEQIIPAGEVCEKCGASEWTKDTDIMDVWFDSGSTHAAVLEERPELHFPADMYMEGGDQFRGWFQSSLLTSVASKGCAPYKSVLCHGWVVDEQGKQMHKSAGNGVEPSEIIKDYGADIIRLWVASSDYTVDVRAGKNIFKQLSEAYRKIRNTARFILGNLDGFDPNTDCVTDDQLQEIDRWALAALDDLIVNAHAGYEVYDFNKVYHAVYNFCVVAMSNFYLDVTKDRLYCTNGAARRAAQTTMYRILVALDKIIAPILCFTSQEIWDFMPKTEGMNKYVVFEDMPKAGQYAADDAFKAKWAQLIAVRDEVKKVLEQARAEKTIGASLEAAVTLYCNDAVYDLLNSIPVDELADLMIVSQVELVKGEGGAASAVEGLGVAAAHATGDKCERCWKYSADIGTHPAHPTLCARCASVVEG